MVEKTLGISLTIRRERRRISVNSLPRKRTYDSVCHIVVSVLFVCVACAPDVSQTEGEVHTLFKRIPVM